MRIQHKPGDEMEVDWAGATIDIYDEVTGEATPAYLFVAVLPCSLYVYAELFPNMKSDTFINCHVHSYAYFGGYTRLLIPDNHHALMTGKRALYRRKLCTKPPCSVLYLVGIYTQFHKFPCF